MKFRLWKFVWTGLLSLFFTTHSAFAQTPLQKVQPLHPELGDLIDAEENDRYRIVGPVDGLHAIRLHEYKANAFRLHILASPGGQPTLRLVPLSAVQKSQLTLQIDNRIRMMAGGKNPPSTFLLTLKPPKAERPAAREFILYDGTSIHGTLVAIRGDTLMVRTPAGLQIPVPDPLLLNVRNLHGEIKQGRFRRLDPNQTRLFFAPTGRPLKKGTGYFADYYVFFPTIAYGVSDNFALAGGMSLIPGASSQLLYFAPRFAKRINDRVSAAMGILYMAIPEEGDDVTLGYVVSTFGGAESAMTFGLGIPLNQNASGSMLLIGGELQVSNNVKLISENWIFLGRDATLLFSGGVRFFGRRLAVDLALIGSDEFSAEEGFPLVPWVDFSVFFGH
ncbi:MAG: hypothetical protein Q9P14_08060 [candidate division KSB1 bacterium]|nr:hypothetical protein [candidate division KSB1 bacterium]MDQ7063895.1 hypothetical protein [candidate division KSB1 bacterium]